MKILIKNGHVLDPLTGFDGVSDVLIVKDKIEKVRKDIHEEADREIDASGCYVMPGFIDMHVHLRDPGFTYKENLATAGRAAAHGGITTMCAMPNTKPVIDTRERVEEIHKRARAEALVHVIQFGSVTKAQAGEELSDIEGMAKASCHGISEDGKSVVNSGLYRRAMRLAGENHILVLAHCEDISLVCGGVMNSGKRAEELGLKGISNAVEDIIAARDILLAKETGASLHLCHCSTADSVKMLGQAKKEGIHVTGEVCPHHFILTDEDITEDNGRFKMNPPLRSKEDRAALRSGLKRGIIDVISTDHAPHAESEKDIPMERAAFGIVGLETSAALTYTGLVEGGILTPMQMAEKMSYNPAVILGLKDKGSVSEGKIADLVVFDPKAQYNIDVKSFFSKGRNTPFDGYPVKGEVIYTFVDGKAVYQKEEDM